MSLIQKYNVAAPRYTSYPTVPYWNNAGFDITSWQALVQQSFQATNNTDERSKSDRIYIHQHQPCIQIAIANSS